ncbi:hypothetical protein HMPREF0518_1334 [Lactobacillus helveticus DSM 20075 = CGMCC 1.1877]|nr:hypothetical protein HMPREF0518_1334 [Lactobacillus helveticus DSM 20075 = CGMCC 1.1877]
MKIKHDFVNFFDFLCFHFVFPKNLTITSLSFYLISLPTIQKEH